MVVYALLAVMALLLPPAASHSHCADVHVIGVRGSGQSAGYGDQVRAVVDGVEGRSRSSALTVESEALVYPAISVSDSFGLVLLNGQYDESVLRGAESLVDRLGDLSSSCSRTGFVLVGYSQGAHVIKAALESSVPLYVIDAVVLLADPTRDHSQSGIVRLGDPSAEREGSFGAIALPDHLRAVAIDVCAPGDGVCERGRRSFAAHTHGYSDVTSVVAAVMAEIAERNVTVVLPL